MSIPNLGIGCYIKIYSITDYLKYKLLVPPFKLYKNYYYYYFIISLKKNTTQHKL